MSMQRGSMSEQALLGMTMSALSEEIILSTNTYMSSGTLMKNGTIIIFVDFSISTLLSLPRIRKDGRNVLALRCQECCLDFFQLSSHKLFSCMRS